MDGGNFILSEEEKFILIGKNPVANKFIKRYIGAEEFIHNKVRYCLWLVYFTPHELNSMLLVIERLKLLKFVETQDSRSSTSNRYT